MQPLTPDDLLSLGEFAGRRPQLFAAHARYLDRYRRVRVGPDLTLVFENRQTLWFRIQEILRVARLEEPARVRQELDWYNHLLPARDMLQAALLIEKPGETFWQELTGEHLAIRIGDVAAASRLVTCRPEDRCFGAAHWLTFSVGEAALAALADNRRPAHIAADYREYQHRSQPLSDLVRRSLLDDLTLSDRDRAA
jgi:hypothetical protein